jgi:glutamate dehydrogenase (NADP+)
MRNIHRMCDETSAEYGSPSDLVKGANIAGVHRVARPMVALGLL